MDDYDGDGMLDRIDVLATALERVERPEESFDLALRAARGDLERARTEVSAGIGDFRLPIVIAIPTIGIAQTLWLMLVIRSCLGLRRDVVRKSLPKEFFGLQTGLAFHRWRIVRRAVPLGAVAIACGAVLWANEILVYRGLTLHATVAAYAVAFGLALYASHRLAHLD